MKKKPNKKQPVQLDTGIGKSKPPKKEKIPKQKSRYLALKVTPFNDDSPADEKDRLHILFRAKSIKELRQMVKEAQIAGMVMYVCNRGIRQYAIQTKMSESKPDPF